MSISKKADALVQGAISDTVNAQFKAVLACDNGSPEGFIKGAFKDVFTGGPESATFLFFAENPTLVGTLKGPGIVHAVFTNVKVKNKNTGQVFKGCDLALFADRINEDQWKGSLTIFCPKGGPNVLTVFGFFTGEVKVNRQVLCQPLL